MEVVPGNEQASIDRLPTTVVEASSPLSSLLEALWKSDPPAAGEINGRWRWHGATEDGSEVRNILRWGLPQDGLAVDPDRVFYEALPAVDPSDHPCQIVMYPVLTRAAGVAGEEPSPPSANLLLFYSIHAPGRLPSEPDRLRAYWRVVEALDRFQDDFKTQLPRTNVRGIDLPMPGWMLHGLRPGAENACPLISP